MQLYNKTECLPRGKNSSHRVENQIMWFFIIQCFFYTKNFCWTFSLGFSAELRMLHHWDSGFVGGWLLEFEVVFRGVRKPLYLTINNKILWIIRFLFLLLGWKGKKVNLRRLFKNTEPLLLLQAAWNCNLTLLHLFNCISPTTVSSILIQCNLNIGCIYQPP